MDVRKFLIPNKLKIIMGIIIFYILYILTVKCELFSNFAGDSEYYCSYNIFSIAIKSNFTQIYSLDHLTFSIIVLLINGIMSYLFSSLFYILRKINK